MAAKTSDKPRKDLSSRQHAFLKAYARGKTLKQAAIEAGYSKKNADQSGYQALKAIKGRAAALMDEIGLTDRAFIENYLVPLLEAKETKFFKDGDKRISVAALGIRHAALDTAFKLRGSNSTRYSLFAFQTLSSAALMLSLSATVSPNLRRSLQRACPVRMSCASPLSRAL